MEINQRLAENVQRLRKEAGISQLQLSENAEITIGMLGDIEYGRANSKLATLSKVAEALSIPPCNLFERYEGESEQPYLLSLLMHHLDLLKDTDDN